MTYWKQRFGICKSLTGVFTYRMRIAHTAGVMFSQFMSFLLFTGGVSGKSALWAHWCYKSTHAHGGVGGYWVSGKVHSEHIVATKVVMPRKGGVSGKVHSEHILATSARYAIDIRIDFLLIYELIRKIVVFVRLKIVATCSMCVKCIVSRMVMCCRLNWSWFHAWLYVVDWGEAGFTHGYML